MANQINRRMAIKLGTATVGLAALPPAASTPAVEPASFSNASENHAIETKQNPICVFTKPFNSMSFDELAQRIAELGFDGIEAPIRKGGHIEPEQVPDQLPQLVEALTKQGLSITVLTSDINDSRDPLNVKVLSTAAALGIKRYRMKYFKYNLKRPVTEQLDEWRSQLVDLAALNRELGITAIYQNHAGANTFGAPIWDMKHVLDKIAVTEIGVAYDIRHATVEGGMSWPISFQMIRPHIDTVYVKDFAWEGSKPKNVPLGEGLVDRKFFKLLADAKFSGPISLHEEYLDHRQAELVPQHLAAIKKDLATLKNWLKT